MWCEVMVCLVVWFVSCGWVLLLFQKIMWCYYLVGVLGLLYMFIGSGKILVMFGGFLLQVLFDLLLCIVGCGGRWVLVLQVLWIILLCVFVVDIVCVLCELLFVLGLDWQVGLCIGDVSVCDKCLVCEGCVDVLVIMFELLVLLLSYFDMMVCLQQLCCVVVDEWYELFGNKWGVLLQLNLCCLCDVLLVLQVWGLLVMFGNFDEVCQVLLFDQFDVLQVLGVCFCLMMLEMLLLVYGECFLWVGYLGLLQLQCVLEWLLLVCSSLLFINICVQVELWYQVLMVVWLEELVILVLYYGLLDFVLWCDVEEGLCEGCLCCVVVMFSLDFGVDFFVVDQVLQVGSFKGIVCLLQCVGWVCYCFGEFGYIICVFLYVLELVEYVVV